MGPGARRVGKNPQRPKQKFPSRDWAGLDEESISGDWYEPKIKEPSLHVLLCARLPRPLNNGGSTGIR